ncbi:hypothetical protein ASG60_03340 [Methylobacterium sp. Leaf469]|uniref:TadE/TadG family type IV pilus assembly protein n=1 Tax=unclassified Methylobacterium TaxID=2615210 RepID=UPI0006FE5BE3|nr:MULTISPECIES: TadE/TadG family type IV pilus assembly protein [unclassified Methylobacterium]KQP34627.1 hypothetical protein ASF27_03565 [Methylobacterium sp. Leaf102]KQU05700.1 hypothetical protein ASG60_03340 [Methylobacterium sp. Leaf469]
MLRTPLPPSRVSGASLPATDRPAPGAFGRFRRARDGVAAVEFALIAPVLLLVYVGSAELARGTMAQRRTTLLTRTVADLTSLGDTTSPMTRTTMDSILAASKLVYSPFDATKAVIRVAAIGIYMQGTTRTVRICSSDASPATAKWPVGLAPASLTIPASYNRHGMRLVVAQVTTPYTPVLGAAYVSFTRASTAEFPLEDTVVWPTRQGKAVTGGADDEVVLPAGVACPVTAN